MSLLLHQDLRVASAQGDYVIAQNNMLLGLEPDDIDEDLIPKHGPNKTRETMRRFEKVSLPLEQCFAHIFSVFSVVSKSIGNKA